MEIIVNKLNYKYSPNSVYETQVLHDISFTIKPGEFVGLIGRTGSGKTTLIHHLNGIIKADSGNIYYDKNDIYDKSYDLNLLRQKVGLVFQYPEYQLFEMTVIEDVKFGPKNQGLDDKQASIKAYEALEMLSFPRDLISQSPFELSGGQKRLAAIAGVLAMDPKVLILDEPTAGLDPKSREDILNTLKKLHDETNKTIILVSHSMDDVAKYAERLLVIDKGRLIYNDRPQNVFNDINRIEAMGLRAPEVTYLVNDLRSVGIDINPVLTSENVVEEICRVIG